MTKLFHVRLELAREHDHPAGDRHTGYDIVAPLDATHRLEPAKGELAAPAWRVRRFEDGETTAVGRIARGPGGHWHFHFSDAPGGDEAPLRLGEETLAPGEYVSVREDDGETHTFRVAQVQPI